MENFRPEVGSLEHLAEINNAVIALSAAGVAIQRETVEARKQLQEMQDRMNDDDTLEPLRKIERSSSARGFRSSRSRTRHRVNQTNEIQSQNKMEGARHPSNNERDGVNNEKKIVTRATRSRRQRSRRATKRTARVLARPTRSASIVQEWDFHSSSDGLATRDAQRRHYAEVRARIEDNTFYDYREDVPCSSAQATAAGSVPWRDRNYPRSVSRAPKRRRCRRSSSIYHSAADSADSASNRNLSVERLQSVLNSVFRNSANTIDEQEVTRDVDEQVEYMDTMTPHWIKSFTGLKISRSEEYQPPVKRSQRRQWEIHPSVVPQSPVDRSFKHGSPRESRKSRPVAKLCRSSTIVHKKVHGPEDLSVRFKDASKSSGGIVEDGGRQPLSDVGEYIPAGEYHVQSRNGSPPDSKRGSPTASIWSLAAPSSGLYEDDLSLGVVSDLDVNFLTDEDF